MLSEQIKLNPESHVFSADTIWVQSPGMSEWLKIQIAQQLGIAANLKFPLPSSFIWSLYQSLIPDVPKTSAFNKDRLRWKIYQLLPNYSDNPEFLAITEYLAQNNTQLSSFANLRRFQLSEKIADAYDNYLVYRPEWLSYWQQGNDDLPGTDDIGLQKWQAILWRGVCGDIEQSGQNAHHRASLHLDLLDKINNSDPAKIKDALPSRLFVFGISSLPSHQVEVLSALSQHIEVNILWFNPCSIYWGDIISEKTLARLSQAQSKVVTTNNQHKLDYFVTGNPLLASWGKVGRDYLDSLAQQDIGFEDIFVGHQANTILTKVQNDILNLEYRNSNAPLSIEALNADTGKEQLPVGDDSIQIHNCHSRYRELEVLKDKLLHWLDNEELMPKDIIVMVPDINDYAPFIDAVFAKNLKSPEQTIPYSISDRSSLSENPLLNTFISLLGLPTSRFTVSEVLDWLEVPLVMDAFNVEASELELIKTWVVECEIKWAVDGQHKSQWSMPAEDINTWLYGLKRMVLGFALDQESVWHGTASYTSIEGLNVNILGKLISFMSYLAQLKARFSDDASVIQWHQRIDELITDLFATDDANDKDFISTKKLREANQQLIEYEHNNDISGTINNLIVQHFFKQGLNESGVSQRFLAGRVNFCTLMPMRSVPFNIVCVLGLNDGEFPRHVEPLSFDLVGLNKPRKGDRARKLDERYLFLEALCSARQKLHLSYLGQSNKNNQELMPSVLLSELIDYLEESYIVDNPFGGKRSKKVKDHVMIRHALQPFNSSYFVDNSGSGWSLSYNNQWFESSRLLSEKTGDVQIDNVKSTWDSTNDPFLTSTKSTDLTPVDNAINVNLDELITFAKNPLKHFYRQQLGLSLNLNDHSFSDVESFEHDGLQRYKHVANLIDLNADIESQTEQAWLTSGAFPPRKWGEDLLNDYQNTVSLMDENLKQLRSEYMAHAKSSSSRNIKLSMELEVDSLSVLLNADFKIDHGLTLVKRLSKDVRADDRIEAWLIHLCRSLSDKPGPTFLVSHNTGDFISFNNIEPEQASTFLKDWLRAYLTSSEYAKPIQWYGRFAYNSAISMLKGVPQHKIIESVRQKINNDIDDHRTLVDEHIIRHFGPKHILQDAFFTITERLLCPLVEHQVEGKMKKLESFMEEYVTQGGLSQ